MDIQLHSLIYNLGRKTYEVKERSYDTSAITNVGNVVNAGMFAEIGLPTPENIGASFLYGSGDKKMLVMVTEAMEVVEAALS